MTDRRIRASLREVETYWTVSDVLDAHLALDALDEAERKAEDEARADARRGR